MTTTTVNASDGAKPVSKRNYGWVEKVMLLPEGLTLHAKLDTGADSCSLHASDMTEFTRDDEKWVRFTVTDAYGHEEVFHKQIWRTVLIKRHGKPSQRRNVIKHGVCVGDAYLETDLTLVDRRNFSYQMLLGRKFLAPSKISVDSTTTYLSTPNCKRPNKK